METLLEFKNLTAVLQKLTTAIKKDYQGYLSSHGKDASGNLSASANSGRVIRVNAGRFEIVFDLMDYWYYVERGAQGAESSPAGALGKVHWPPPQAIADWIRIKPVIPRPDSRGRIPTPAQLTYLIGRKIYTEGIEPAPAMTTAVASNVPAYQKEIEEAILKDVTGYVDIIVNQAFSGFTE